MGSTIAKNAIKDVNNVMEKILMIAAAGFMNKIIIFLQTINNACIKIVCLIIFKMNKNFFAKNAIKHAKPAFL